MAIMKSSGQESKRQTKKRGGEPRFVRERKEKSGRAAASYSELLLVVVRGVITMMPFSPLYLVDRQL
jgi:hypothetical protein